MKRFWLLALSGLSVLIFWGCPTSPNTNNYDYLRSPITFRVDTLPATHAFCSSLDTPFPTPDSCLHAKKYALRWERPEDTAGFLEYRIYLDTTPPNAGNKSWNDVRQDSSLASAIVPGLGGTFDSLIFVFGNTNSMKSAPRSSNRIVSFDTTGRIDGQGRLVFAIVAAYQGRADGPPRYTWVITNDKFAPFPLHPLYTPYDHRVEIKWARPLDPTSFFNPLADTGIIPHYILRVLRGGILNASTSAPFQPIVHFENGDSDWSDRVRTDSFMTEKGVPGRRYILPDSQHVYNSAAYDPRDSLKVVLSGFIPQDTLDISLWAVDNSGNLTPSETTLVNRVILTDTTEPVAPLLRLLQDSLSRNRIIYGFQASRDLVEKNGSTIPADSPNTNIREYRLTRKLISGSAGGVPSKDTIISVDASNRKDTLFIDTVRFLPPGANYRIYVQAVDSSGHLSQRDSLDASTATVGFQGSDSTCPTGFVPIPGGSFLLGDTGSMADADEKQPKQRFIGSFCIENYEHRDSAGKFETHVSWQQAQETCAEISPDDSTHLCTETEWERACEGPDSPPLRFGFQSENPANPNAVFSVCNVGTGDSDMATNQSLRNPICLTREGVFDMSGNLAEWVLDPYSSTAYSQTKDTLIPGAPLVTQTLTGTHGYRGGYYLNSHQPSTTKPGLPDTNPAQVLRRMCGLNPTLGGAPLQQLPGTALPAHSRLIAQQENCHCVSFTGQHQNPVPGGRRNATYLLYASLQCRI
jgi:hypothetical protein